MENTNQIVEVVDDVIENTGGSTLGNVAIIGGAMVVGAVLWDKALKPLGRFLKGKLVKAKENHKNKTKTEDKVNETKDAKK